MIRACFDCFGEPAEVLGLEEFSATPGPGELRLRWLAAPVNPADLNFIEGVYGDRPELPATPGMEGVAEVEELGPGVADLEVGQQVIARRRLGSWSSHTVARAEDLWAIPPDLYGRAPIEQWAQLRINPLTALRLLTGFTELREGDVVLVNAANSGVGQALLQLARTRGLVTACFARREEALEPLRKLDPDALFFVDDEHGHAAAREALADRAVPLACNCVGGDSTLAQLKLISPHGVQVTYGAMARRASKLPAGLMIFKELRLEGLWITRWQARAPREEVDTALGKLATAMAESHLRLPVDSIHPLTELRAALTRAAKGRREGKVILDLQA